MKAHNISFSSASSSLIVLKFGGTSVSQRGRWDTIAEVARRRIGQGFRPLIVCSALSGVTNLLEKWVSAIAAGQSETPYFETPFFEAIVQQHRDLAQSMGLEVTAILGSTFETLQRLAMGAALIGEVSPRLHARLLAFGEVMSTQLGEAYLRTLGLRSVWLDARDYLVSPPNPLQSLRQHYLSATCDDAPDEALIHALGQLPGDIYVTQGFIARDSQGDTVVLGRGGSDTSAAYFAAKLGAQRCEIWTDVPGMYTANPKAIPEARLLSLLDYDEAQEIASSGAKVLHPRCIAPVRRHQIPMWVLCTERPDLPGTVIQSGGSGQAAQVKALSAKMGVTLISMDTVGMWQQVGFLADVFQCFKQHKFSIDLVSTSEFNVTVSLDPQANLLTPQSLQALMEDLKRYCTACVIGPCASVSLVGRDIRAILHRLGPVFELFREHKIYLLSQAASDLNLTFVIDEAQCERLTQQLHALLFHHSKIDATFGPSWQETFTKPEAALEASRTALAGQSSAAQPWWHTQREKLLAMAAQNSPLYVYDEATVRAQASQLKSLTAVTRLFYAVKANDAPPLLRWIMEEGAHFECVSAAELAHVRSHLPELAPDRLLFTPNFAPQVEYEAALKSGHLVTLDNLHPLTQWPALWRGRDIILRVDPGTGYGHHHYVQTAGERCKFGIAPSELEAAREAAMRCGAQVVGLHAHSGSGVFDVQTWLQTAALLARIQSELFPGARILNIGGGLGVPYDTSRAPLDMAALGQALLAFHADHPNCELWLEPGRYWVAEAGVLLTRVTQIKHKEQVTFVGVDTGMNSLIRPALYGAHHAIHNLTRLHEAPTQTAQIVGPICESADILGYDRPLPQTEEGDVLLIDTVGAYGRTMASHYNLRAPAAEQVITLN